MTSAPMPSTSPGTTSSFAQILPGTPTESLQSFTTFIFRFKRYVAYISGSQLSILSGPNCLVQALRFKHELVAIAAEARSGKVVVGGKENVWVLRPLTEGWTKVWWEKTLLLRRDDLEDTARWLSWGDDGEVLVAGDKALTLFSALPSSRATSPAVAGADDDDVEERKAIWTQRVASPIWQAEFSPTATMIATRAKYDRLVKIWRRLSFEECLFDHTYLPHPGAVTHLQWRPAEENFEERRGSGISGRHDDEPEVLYTIASDAVLRVWRTGGHHEVDILNLYTTVDLISAIPQSPSLTIKGQSQPARAPRYAVVMPSDQFCAAVNAAIGLSSKDKVSHSKELLKEMVSKQPDVLVAFDGNGRMSAWGLEGVGHRHPTEDTTIAHAYHIAHAEGLSVRVPSSSPAICGTWFQDDKLHLLAHDLGNGGEISWWQGNVETFFSPSAPGEERLALCSTWTGHDGQILGLQPSGDGVLSRSSNEITQWTPGRTALLKPRRSFGLGAEVLAATTIDSGRLILTVTSSAFALWDDSGRRIAKAPCKISKGGVLKVLSSDASTISGIFVPKSAERTTKWTATLPAGDVEADDGNLQLEQMRVDQDHPAAPIAFAVPVTKAHRPHRNCVAHLTEAGTLAVAAVQQEGSLLDSLATFDTGIASPSGLSATGEFAVVTAEDSKNIVIIDLLDGYIEHQQSFKTAVLHVACFTSNSSHNLVAIGTSKHVEVLAQGRYEHRASGVLTWSTIKNVSVDDLGLEITALTWMSNGSLALAAGNGVFLTESELDVGALNAGIGEALNVDADEKPSLMQILDISQRLRAPLPVWHPSLLEQLVLHGYPEIAASILRRLAQRLKFWSVGEALDSTLGVPPDELLHDEELQKQWLDEEAVKDLEEQLDEKSLPGVSRAEQQRLRAVIHALVYLGQHVKGLDHNALRYLFDWKLQLLIAQEEGQLAKGSSQANGVKHLESVPEMNWREICFAYHSTTQQALLDVLITHYDNKMTWEIARRLGVMSWLADREALENVFEQVGQTSYRSEQPPDPVNATLYYLALRKKPTLLGLWRIATWHKEQRTTMNFLKRDFSQADAKVAAKKNAYALMGRRRFHYSAAFFLLADDPASATSVLAGQCEDAPLAIAVARLYCGGGSPVLQKLLESRVVPQAEKEGNRWLMSWCHSSMLDKQKAAEILVQPLDGARTWQQDEPATLLLYKQMRKVPSQYEYKAVLRTARILRRMGLWLLAMDVVSRWEFKEASPTRSTSVNGISNGITNGAHNEPRSMLDDFTDPPTSQPGSEPPSILDGFSSPEPVKSAGADEKSERQAKAAELLAKIKAKKDAATPAKDEKKPAPTQFKEPDPNSLLDSFGF